YCLGSSGPLWSLVVDQQGDKVVIHRISRHPISQLLVEPGRARVFLGDSAQQARQLQVVERVRDDPSTRLLRVPLAPVCLPKGETKLYLDLIKVSSGVSRHTVVTVNVRAKTDQTDYPAGLF